jgi:hypothetical protein
VDVVETNGLEMEAIAQKLLRKCIRRTADLPADGILPHRTGLDA